MDTKVAWPYSISNEATAQDIVVSLKRNGWVLLPDFLSSESINTLKLGYREILDCRQEESELRVNDTGFSEFLTSDALSSSLGESRGLFANHPESIEAVTAAILDNEVLQSISNLYLGREAVFASRIQFIRTYAMPEERNLIPYAKHYDRVRFLKFYVYLNDISEEQGAIEMGDKEWVSKAQALRERLKASGKAWNECDGEPTAYDGILRPVEATKGSVLVFDSNQPHCHGVFNADVEREVCIVESQLIEELEFGYMGQLAASARKNLESP